MEVKYKVLIAGGSGLIGKKVSDLLVSKGIEVCHLSREVKSNSPYKTFQWNPAKGEMDYTALNGVTHIINLAGNSISGKSWSTSYKKEIIESRLDAVATLLKSVKQFPNAVTKIIAASAIGYYGNRNEELCTEEMKPGMGFLPDAVCEWENAYSVSKLPTAILRIGVVLSKEGGALPELIRPLAFGVIPILGDGKQWVSWIAMEDLAELFLIAVTNDNFVGIQNAVAPNPVRNKGLMLALKKQRKINGINIRIPKLLLHLLLGEKSAIILDSIKVSAKIITNPISNNFGYAYRYDTINKALAHIYGNE